MAEKARLEGKRGSVLSKFGYADLVWETILTGPIAERTGLLGRLLEGTPRLSRPGLVFLLLFIALRTIFFATFVEAPEPRYVLECYPAILALAAQVWSRDWFSPKA